MSNLTAPRTPRDALPPRLGRYDVRAKIGDGGMATVYLGKLVGPPGLERSFERVVALKVIKQEFCKHPEFVTMFLDEAKIISRLSHPNCVQVIELGTEGDRLFIAMELLLGQSLWDVWDACRTRGVRLRYDLAAWIGARVAEGLHHAHEMRDATGQPQQLVHRDVNASNIFITYEGHVKVIDFGLAKAKNSAYKTAAGVVKGKLAYLSPEQVAGGKVDRRADVFALGTTLWELTTDRRLFRVKDDAETLKRVYECKVDDPSTIVDGYPPALWQVLKRALARDASTRYATAADFARSLDELARCEGRAVDANALADVMRALFAEQRERDKKWLSEASAPDGATPLETMHPPHAFTHLTHPPPPEPTSANSAAFAPPAMPKGLASDTAHGWTGGAPPDGMFSPAPSRPFHVPLAHEATTAATQVGAMGKGPDEGSRTHVPSALIAQGPATPHADPTSAPLPAPRAAEVSKVAMPNAAVPYVAAPTPSPRDAAMAPATALQPSPTSPLLLLGALAFLALLALAGWYLASR